MAIESYNPEQVLSRIEGRSRRVTIMSEVIPAPESAATGTATLVNPIHDVPSPEARTNAWLNDQLEKPEQNQPRPQTKRYGFTEEQVRANAELSEEERLKAAEKLSMEKLQTGPLTEEQGKALQRMHEVGKDRPGAEVYKYDRPEIKEKVRIGKEVFTKEQRSLLLESGLAGLPDWIKNAQVESRPSDFEAALSDKAGLAKVDRSKLLVVDPVTGANQQVEYDNLVKQNQHTIDQLINEALTANNGVISDYFYKEISILYREITSEPVSSYGERESRRSTEDRLKMARRSLDNYQETFWEFGNPKLTGLQQKYKGVVAYLASRALVAIEKKLKGETLSSKDDKGEELIRNIDRATEERKKLEAEQDPLWDRSWGRILLTGRTPEEVIRGIDNFLNVATAEDSNFEANRNLQDADQLNQEIQRRGQQVGMSREAILEQVARAEGTLLISVADHFAVRWNVPEWHQVASKIGTHIDTRLNAVSKAHDAEVMHAAYILDNDKEYDQYSRQARFSSDLSAKNDEAAASKRDEVRRKLEVRIALSKLKDINDVIRDQFLGIEAKIDSFGFDRKSTSVVELFENSQYLAEIKRISDKLAAFNKKYAANPQTVTATDKLEDWEKQLITLDRIRSDKINKTADLVLIDQTDKQFTDLYEEWGGCRDAAGNYTEAAYKAEIVRLQPIIQRLQQKISNQEQLTDDEMEQVRFWQRNELLKKMDSGNKLTDEEIRPFPEILRARQAVDLAIKTRSVFFISAEKACASVKTRRDTTEGKGELLSYNDVVRLNKFVRERALVSLPQNIAQKITSATRGGAGLMYVDIADKLEFRNLSKRVITEKGEGSDFGKSAEEALRLIALTEGEKEVEKYVQAVEDIQEKVLEKLKAQGSGLTVVDIDTIISQVFQTHNIDFRVGQSARIEQAKSVHRGKARKEPSVDYKDIVNREDADPQYNFSMTDDQKYSSLLLSDEIKAAAYNPDHPYYLSAPAIVRRVLDPDGTKLMGRGDPDIDRADVFKLQETQRRFHFAVDSVKVFGAFYKPDPYVEESAKPTIAEMVINIRNAPFIGRRMIEQRTWTLWNRGQAYRGRGFLKYLESNFRGLDHTVGRKGLRGVVTSYNGLSNPKGFDYERPNFSGILDELAAERFLEEAKGADAVRPVLIGGQVGQNPSFEGIFKKVLNTPGRVNKDRKAAIQIENVQSGSVPNWADAPVLIRMRDKIWKDMAAGDYETAINDTAKIWERVILYGKSLSFVGNTSHIPLSAKFTGDTAIKRMAYWTVAHPEAMETYNINSPIARLILEPLPQSFEPYQGAPQDEGISYFGKNATLLSELLRREILAK